MFFKEMRVAFSGRTSPIFLPGPMLAFQKDVAAAAEKSTARQGAKRTAHRKPNLCLVALSLHLS